MQYLPTEFTEALAEWTDLHLLKLLTQMNFGFSLSFIAPAAVESNFYYISQNQMNFGQVHIL